MELPEVKNKKGLTVLFSADAEYCGFNISLGKKSLELRLGFCVLRIFLVSEAMFHRVVTIATLQDSPSHEVTVIKPNEYGVFDESAPRL